MVTIYVKELKENEFFKNIKLSKGIKKFLFEILKKLKYIKKVKIDEYKILYLLSSIESEYSYKKLQRKIEKIKKVQIVLAKNIKEYGYYLKHNKIVDGKEFFIDNMEKIIKKALGEIPIETQNFYLLTNRYSNQSLKTIELLAPKIKMLNIITKEIKKYEKLEEKMQEKGIVLSIANNKKKSLKNAKIIINLDFSKEELQKYIIYRDALIINLTQEKILNLNGFNGIVVQDIEVEEKENFKDIKLFEDFKLLDIYESFINKKIDFKIINLYGNNGKINEKELLNWQKILTN